MVRDLILGATDRAEEKSINTLPSSPKSTSTRDILFLHFQYHKDGITRQEIRKEYETHLETICKEELGIHRMIVAFSTAKNIINVAFEIEKVVSVFGNKREDFVVRIVDGCPHNCC